MHPCTSIRLPNLWNAHALNPWSFQRRGGAGHHRAHSGLFREDQRLEHKKSLTATATCTVSAAPDARARPASASPSSRPSRPATSAASPPTCACTASSKRRPARLRGRTPAAATAASRSRSRRAAAGAPAGRGPTRQPGATGPSLAAVLTSRRRSAPRPTLARVGGHVGRELLDLRVGQLALEGGHRAAAAVDLR